MQINSLLTENHTGAYFSSKAMYQRPVSMSNGIRAVEHSIVRTSVHSSRIVHTKKNQWVAFDLDDTLHKFKHAASIANNQVIEEINREHNYVSKDLLKQHYQKICKELVTSFIDGRTSREYRTERFLALLRHFKLPINLAENLADEYGRTFEDALVENYNARDVLKSLQVDGIKVAVISEGPHDAQQRTLSILSMQEHVDLLITSNKERVSKRDGLFARFIAITKVVPEKTLMVGDSLLNDIYPAKEAGLIATLYDPNCLSKPNNNYLIARDLAEVVALSQKFGK